jgi:hypothetical protein
MIWGKSEHINKEEIQVCVIFSFKTNKKSIIEGKNDKKIFQRIVLFTDPNRVVSYDNNDK